jgi:hypothetical protein
VYYLRQRRKAINIEKAPEKELIKSHKILTLVSDTVEVD